MRKVLIVARREYRAMVATKAFLIVLAMMPMLMGGSIIVQRMLAERVNLTEKRIVVLDHTGALFDALQQAAEKHNEHAIFDPKTGAQTKPRYGLELGPKGPATERLRLELSDRARRDEIYAFVEIPADVFAMPAGAEETNNAAATEGAAPNKQGNEHAAKPGAAGGGKVIFYAQNAVFSEEKRWLQQTLSDLVERHRLKQLNVDPEVVDRASAPVWVEQFGLLEQSKDGEVKPAEPKNEEMAIFLPFGIMMLMFMVTVLTSQPMMESVMEERNQRIAEVLLGSATPSQLMAGKLLGSVAGSLTIVLVYGLGAWGVAQYYEVAHLVPLRLLPWFLVYQVLAVLLFGSIFMAVGACVTGPKEAQSMLMPVWLLVMFPMFVWLNVVREPTSSFAMWLSFVPPATSLLMVLRMASSPDIPLWQPALGVVILLAATGLCVFAAGRVFRIGILAQGQVPKLKQLLRWIVSAG